MWKSRRELQRAMVDDLKLTQQLAADFERQDDEDDFSGVDQRIRTELGDVTAVIARYLVQYKSLVVFHNGSEDVVHLTDFGIPVHKYLGTKVVWTFRGRLRLNSKIVKKVEASDFYIVANDTRMYYWNAHLVEDAREIALHTQKLGLGVTPEIATKCCLYLLSLNKHDTEMIDYKWATHASSYWVCDGIIGGGHDSHTWEVAHALQQHIKLEDYSSNTEPMSYSMGRLNLSSKQWVSITKSYFQEVPPKITTLFFGSKNSSPQVVSLPSDKFHKAKQLRVLKLCGCTFNFSSPPFHCCHSLRFLGLDRCTDELQQGEEEEKTGEPAMEIFQRLWVLDVCHTDWPLAFPPKTKEEMVATDIREVHITNGRIWHNNLSRKQLRNLHKLRVVEPTNHVETYQGLPSSLESFSLDAGRDNEAIRTSCISLAGCTILSDFILRGSLPNLEELNLSHTAIKILDLGEVIELKNLQRLFMMGCKQLRSISWPKTKMYKLRLLCIDTREGGEVDNRKPAWSHDSLIVYLQDEVNEYCHASVAVADMRFLQSLEFLWKSENIQCYKWNLCLSSTSKNDDGRSCHKEKMLAVAPSLPKSVTYHDINIEQISAKIDVSSSSSSAQFLPLNMHMEIGEGVSDVTNRSSMRARDAVRNVMNGVQSLHVHDNSSFTTISPELIFSPDGVPPSAILMNRLMWCRVERCTKLDIVFTNNYYYGCFNDLEIFWATHLLMAGSIWSRSRNLRWHSIDTCFRRLRAIHLHFCPRLRYVLPMASHNTLSKVLETLHIHCCGGLKQVFLVEQEFLERISVYHDRARLEFSNLKRLYLYDLISLQHICDARMFAPKLETIYIRGCWGLRRLPATDSRRRQDGRPVAVDCEKDWWDKLEWDGMESGHHPSLFDSSHSKYYKRRHLRTTVLR